jgi:hypothetical protein
VARQLAKLWFPGFLLLAVFQLFSPWQIVVQRRSPKLSPDAIDQNIVQQEDPVKIQEQALNKDYIESNFGLLEDAYLASVGKSSVSRPIRSRDDSIRLLYSTKNATDWLNLVNGHDEHVFYLPTI